MRCLVCNTINHANARFCTDCGASLAPTAWTRSAPTEGGYAMAPAPGLVPAPPTYAPSPPSPHMVSSLSAAPGMYPTEAAAHANAYAPYGYVPAPAPYGYAPAPPPAPINANGPSLVNNVTVHQVTPQAPASPPTPQAKWRGKRRASDVTVLLAALYFLASGIAIGMMWTTVHAYDGGTEVAAALAVTFVALLIDIMILARITRR